MMQVFRARRRLSLEQMTMLAVCDAWLTELDEIVRRIESHEVVYRRLSPIWAANPAEEFEPDELHDPIRRM